MAFDGITVSAVIGELKKDILNGKIDKIYQPEKDDIILQIRCFGKVRRLFLSANPSGPRLNFTENKYENPQTPPLFCMVLRKHIGGGKITDICQPDFERQVIIKIEALNELGDYVTTSLILEIMGRHSNLILVNSENKILEAARHINFEVSSVREVLPGKLYENPPSQNKKNPLYVSEEDFISVLKNSPPIKLQQLIYKSYTGIGPISASEICHLSGLDPSMNRDELTKTDTERLYRSFNEFFGLVKNQSLSPTVYFEKDMRPKEFSPIELSCLSFMKSKSFDSVSEMIEAYYSKRDIMFRLSQKTHDLRKLIMNNIERCSKKRDIQERTLKSVENRDKHRLYGELLISYAYNIENGADKAQVVNFYDENMAEVTIPMNPDLSPAENAQVYFKKYNKEKRTFQALGGLIKETEEELYYLEGLLSALKSCTSEQDIKEIRRELFEQGYIKKHKSFEKNKKNLKKSQPLHYVSSDGFDIFVGKNNTQNDELTMKTASAGDLWLHTKQIPGSHVIIFTKGKNPTDTAIKEAALLAAYNSRAKQGSLVPVDYTYRKYVKKPNGAKPGFVIYTTNKTIYVTPSEEALEKIRCLS